MQPLWSYTPTGSRKLSRIYIYPSDFTSMRSTNLYQSLFGLFVLFLSVSTSNAQTLPIDFEGDVTTSNFVDFDGGTATVIANPQMDGINTSATVAQIVRNGGEIFAGSKLILPSNLDFSVDNSFRMKVFTTAPIGTVVKFKLEGQGATERDMRTTKTNEWEEIRWDFTGTPAVYNELVFMFDFGNVGDGSATSTFLFDDITQFFGGNQIDLPVTFDDPNVNYTLTDFEGAASALTVDPEDASNRVAQVMKPAGSGTSAGTTIGTNSGFASVIPLTLASSKMNVRVFAPSGIPVRLKVENGNDPTQTCETQTMTTISGWQTLEFDFTNEAAGTESLANGLSMGWLYSQANIFFDFGTGGTGQNTYYFDDVRFGSATSNTRAEQLTGVEVFPNPASDVLRIDATEAFDQVRILSATGQEVFVAARAQQLRVDLSAFAAGIYFVHVQRGEQKLVERVVVE